MGLQPQDLKVTAVSEFSCVTLCYGFPKSLNYNDKRAPSWLHRAIKVNTNLNIIGIWSLQNIQ